MSLSSLFTSERAEGPFTVLTVCTGNICRSPLAETLLDHVLSDLGVKVHSAGTHAMVGHPMTEQNCIIASELGVEHPETHRARQLTKDLIAESDLVLALTRDHRRAVVEMLPRASRHTFTLREFGRLTEAVDLSDLPKTTDTSPDRGMRDVIELVAQLRGSLVPLEDPAEDDVIDPYQKSDEVYARSAKQLVPPINLTSKLLRRAALARAA